MQCNKPLVLVSFDFGFYPHTACLQTSDKSTYSFNFGMCGIRPYGIGSCDAPRFPCFADSVFDSNSRQKDVFTAAALPVVQDVLEGYNGCLLAYGQVSSFCVGCVWCDFVSNDEKNFSANTGRVRRYVGYL